MARLGKAYDSPRKQRFIGRVLADENQNVAAAARAERINPRSARNIWHKYLETGTTHRRPGSGRPSKLTPADKRLIVRTVRKNRRMPFGEVGNLVNGSVTLVRNVLRPKGYHRRVAKRKPYLKPEHKDGRLSWARENANRRGWDDVAWSDESYIYLGGSRNRVFVTRRADEKYEEDCLIPTFTQSPIHVMVWGCVMQDRKGPLIALEYPGGKGGGMTGARYSRDHTVYRRWTHADRNSMFGDVCGRRRPSVNGLVDFT